MGLGAVTFLSFLGGCVLHLASIVRFWTLVEGWSSMVLIVTDGLSMSTLEIRSGCLLLYERRNKILRNFLSL